MNKVQEITTALFTHLGRRPQNEDRACIYDFNKNDVGGRKLLIVADGMGGYNAGEIASQIAVDEIIAHLVKALPLLESTDDLSEALDAAIKAASDEIYRQASTDPSSRGGMGTTIAVVLVLADRLFIANVGDSRIYLIANGLIRKVSEDHTALAEAMKTREMTEEEIRNFEYRHTITRSLGDRMPPQIYMNEIVLPSDSVLILCSDGLTDIMPDDEILKQVIGISDLQATVDNLGRRAFHQGSTDNITILAVELGNLWRTSDTVDIENAIPKVPHYATRKKKSDYRIGLAVTFFALIITASALFYLYYAVWSKNYFGPAHNNKVINIQHKAPFKADAQTSSVLQQQDAKPKVSLQEIMSKKDRIILNKPLRKESAPK